jgi:hypothetical protein
MKDLKWIYLKEAIANVTAAMKREFPRYPWDIAKVREKYLNERKRYRSFLLLLAISGASYDYETGLVMASEEIWDKFLTKYPKAKWLRTASLGDRDTYSEVFFREKASGKYIREARALVGRDHVVDDRESGDDSDSDSDDDEELDLDDPDQNPDIDVELDGVSAVPAPQSSATQNSSSGRRFSAKRSKETDAQHIARSIDKLATSNTKVPGLDEVKEAVQDLQTGFRDKLSSLDLSVCIEKLATPVWAGIWLTLSPEVKGEYTRRWVEEAEEARR